MYIGLKIKNDELVEVVLYFKFKSVNEKLFPRLHICLPEHVEELQSNQGTS